MGVGGGAEACHPEGVGGVVPEVHPARSPAQEAHCEGNAGWGRDVWLCGNHQRTTRLSAITPPMGRWTMEAKCLSRRWMVQCQLW